LTFLSALLVSVALNLLIEARNSMNTAVNPGVGYANMVISALVLAANVYGTAVLILQKHKAALRISRKRYRGAIQGWQRLWTQRQNAVMAITYSLPGILAAGAMFEIGGSKVKTTDLLSRALSFSLLTTFSNTACTCIDVDSRICSQALASLS